MPWAFIKSRALQLFKNSLIYLLSGVAGKAVPFLLLPVLTRYLTPSEFGLVAIFQLGIQLSQAVSGLSLNVNISRYFFSRNKEEIATLIFDIYLILLSSCFLLLAILFISVLFFDNFFGLPSRWVLALPFLAFMSMSNLLNQTLLRTMERPISFMKYEIGLAAANFILIVFFVVFLTLSWEGQNVAVSISLIIFGILALRNIVKEGYVRVNFNFLWVRKILSVSLPLVPHAIAGVVISVSDRFFLERMVGIDAVGVYSVGYYFGMVIMLFSDAFVKAWNPWFFKKMANPNPAGKKLIVKYTYAYIVALSIGAIFYSKVAVFILPFVVAEAYLGAVEYIPWICLGYVLFGVYQIFFPYFIYSGKTIRIAIATVIAAMVNLVANYFLIKEYGPVGAAYATILAFAVSSLIVVCMACGQVKMPWLSTDRV